MEVVKVAENNGRKEILEFLTEGRTKEKMKKIRTI